MENPIAHAVEKRLEDGRVAHSNLNSWRRCYDMFGRSGQSHDTLALQLGFFLASWGMMRASSFLARFDYTVHLPVVDLLLRQETQSLRGATPDSPEIISKIIDTKYAIEETYGDLDPRKRDINVTDTLSSKIMLATLGCVPAYDRFFVAGVRRHKIVGSFSKRSLLELNRHLADFELQYAEAKELAEAEIGSAVPMMRVVDMYFFTEGERAEPLERND